MTVEGRYGATSPAAAASSLVGVDPRESARLRGGGGEYDLGDLRLGLLCPDIFVLKHESSIFRSVIQPCMWFLHDGTGLTLYCLASGELARHFQNHVQGGMNDLNMLLSCFRTKMSACVRRATETCTRPAPSQRQRRGEETWNGTWEGSIESLREEGR